MPLLLEVPFAVLVAVGLLPEARTPPGVGDQQQLVRPALLFPVSLIAMLHY